MHEVKATLPGRIDRTSVLDALRQTPDLPEGTVSTVTGFGKRQPPPAGGRPERGRVTMTKLELVVPDGMLPRVLAAFRQGRSQGIRATQGLRPPRRTSIEVWWDAHGVDAL